MAQKGCMMFLTISDDNEIYTFPLLAIHHDIDEIDFVTTPKILFMKINKKYHPTPKMIIYWTSALKYTVAQDLINRQIAKSIKVPLAKKAGLMRMLKGTFEASLFVRNLDGNKKMVQEDAMANVQGTTETEV